MATLARGDGASVNTPTMTVGIPRPAGDPQVPVAKQTHTPPAGRSLAKPRACAPISENVNLNGRLIRITPGRRGRWAPHAVTRPEASGSSHRVSQPLRFTFHPVTGDSGSVTGRRHLERSPLAAPVTGAPITNTAALIQGIAARWIRRSEPGSVREVIFVRGPAPGPYSTTGMVDPVYSVRPATALGARAWLFIASRRQIPVDYRNALFFADIAGTAST